MAATGAVRCQRIGCDAIFTEDNNTEGSCRYHDSPIFHDDMKEWSCCKQRSLDFSLFLAIPGCKIGKHTIEKPVTKIVPDNPPKPAVVPSSTQSKKSEDSCSRCRQGFFCSDHGSQGRSSRPAVVTSTPSNSVQRTHTPPKKVGLDEPPTCRNGCGKTFKERDNHESACEFHPGPAVFHDRMRGWKCCDIFVKEFDEFMTIPPCTKGWHNANAA